MSKTHHLIDIYIYLNKCLEDDKSVWVSAMNKLQKSYSSIKVLNPKWLPILVKKSDNKIVLY